MLYTQNIKYFSMYVYKGAMIATKRDNAPLLPMVMGGLNAVLGNPTTPFMTGKMMDLFFNGYPLRCAPDETDVGALGMCQQLGERMARIDEEHIGFALFAPVRIIARVNSFELIKNIFACVCIQNNGTSMGRFKALRGTKNIHDLGKLVQFNEEEEIDTYDEDACNQIRGTDSTIFPPFLKKEEGLWAFAPDLCRSLGAEYKGKSSYMGVKTSEFTINFPDLRVNINQIKLSNFYLLHTF